MKATVAQAKRLGAQREGWSGFKHRLMRYLGVPDSQFYQWNVPLEWQYAFLKANERKPK